MSIKAREGRTKSLNALINKDTSVLGGIFNQAAKLQHIETLVLHHLPDESRDYYRVGNYQAGRLLLLTPSALQLTRFRYLKPELLLKLQTLLPELKDIELKVRPTPPASKEEPKGKPISEQTRLQLLELAKETDNPKLKSALTSIGKKQKSQQ
ncbi:DciA family protein [Marinospirillum perlucidum]|uniref:DciA family protein n=1 Tax=Marinospirillum perlucidum TaxID=1982602 RepID=UPI000DF1938B|nr:DciA family protein [Marinospirillum perlucidum]